MVPELVHEVERLHVEAFSSAWAGLESGSDDELIALLRVHAATELRAQRAQVETISALQRAGVFAKHGQRPDTAIADLLGIERFEARRLVIAAEQVMPRVDLQGQVLPALLPATAAAFATGSASVRHVEVITRLMASPPARNLQPYQWAGAEEQIAALTGSNTPTEVRRFGTRLLEALDQDGAEPDDREPAETNEMFLTRNASGNGGYLKARIDNAAMYDQIAGLIDAKAAPLTKDDHRPLPQRQAEAMAEIFGWVAEHGDSDIAPSTGGRRPQVNVLIRLEDLENRGRAAALDFGGFASPTSLRMLCCDACVVPIVMNGAGQPLDVGRATRTIPVGLRNAVAGRDGGCAHPGCDRPVSWSEIHHILAWELGGETKLANLVMLCRIHHAEMHSSQWSVRIAADGVPEFFPPKWLDPRQLARRKPRIPDLT